MSSEHQIEFVIVEDDPDEDGMPYGVWECTCGKEFEQQQDGEIHVRARCFHADATRLLGYSEGHPRAAHWQCKECRQEFDSYDAYLSARRQHERR